MDQSIRQLIVEWQDPRLTAGKALEMSGLAFLDAMRRGEIPAPPIASLLGMTLAEVEEGRAVFSLEPAEPHYNPIGVVHGGIAATLLDSCMGCAVHSTLPLGRAYTTLEIKVNMVRPVTLASGLLRAEGKVIHAGRQTATAEGRLTDAQGRLCAHGSTTCMLFDVPPRGA